MKIYFEDDRILYGRPFDHGVPETCHIIDAAIGYSSVMYELADMESLEALGNEDIIVYTNSTAALSTKYCWNSEMKVPELYLRTSPTQFTRVDKLTDKEIHKLHNLMQMFMNGAFRGYPKYRGGI